MPKKKSEWTPGMKLLAAYYLLLFSGRPHSLTEIATQLKCSKSQASRVMAQIETSGLASIIVEERGPYREHWYSLAAPRKRPNVSLDVDDIQNLLICRDLVWHLLPETFRQDLTKTVSHATVLLPDFADRGIIVSNLATSRPKGGVDYTGKEEIIDALITAMKSKTVCRVEYRGTGADKPRTHYYSPFRLIAHRDALFVKGWRLWKDEVPPEVHEMTLAVARIQNIDLQDWTYQDEGSCEEPESKSFGLIEAEPFKVKVAFDRWTACYVSERVWSEDQQITSQDDGGIILEFTSTSWPEVIAWVLSFGPGAKVLEPQELADDVAQAAQNIALLYM